MYVSASLVACLHFIILAAALPQPASTSYNTTLNARAIEVKNLPTTRPECRNAISKGPAAVTYGRADVQAAIELAVEVILAGAQYQKNKKGAAYPHVNTPGNNQSSIDERSDFDLADCAQENSDQSKKYGFVEYPILRNHKSWKGESDDQGPDRVLFQFVTNGDAKKTYGPGFTKLVGDFEYAAHCGIINHVVQDDRFLGGFAPCENSKG